VFIKYIRGEKVCKDMDAGSKQGIVLYEIVFYNQSCMDWTEKLALLSQDLSIEVDELPAGVSEVPPACHESRRSAVSSRLLEHVGHVTLRGGQKMPVLKVLLTSACEYNCAYCPFRAGRDFRRATFQPEELARGFVQMSQAGLVQGLFLSSGIVGGGVKVQDKLLATAEVLRQRLGYQGYLHLKLMPGAEQDQVEQAVALASRVSINLEAPTSNHLQRLAPRKAPGEALLQPLRWAHQAAMRLREGPAGRFVSLSTQFVVGTGETDAELLRLTHHLYRRLNLSRVYYSAFRPIPDTPLEDQEAENPLRALRLYQASFLVRDYGFDFEELPLGPEGYLELETDPKTAWAQRYLTRPIEVNRADKEQLMRIPGIGPKTAMAILHARRIRRLREPEQLRRLGVNLRRAAPFILLDGRHMAQQPMLWDLK